jgi:hypothetical protein
MSTLIPVRYNLTFWLHLLVTALSWFIPLLFDWKLVLLAYTAVMLQFSLFGRCLMNRAHDLEDTGNDHTFYAHLLEHLGFRFDRRRVKTFVRFWIYVLLGVMAVTWQVGFGQEALVF